MRSTGNKVRTTSPKVVFRIPCNETSGNFDDVSGNAINAVVGVSNADAYDNAGWMTTTAGSGQAFGCACPIARLPWDMRYDVLLLSVNVIVAATATARNLMGSCGTGVDRGFCLAISGGDKFRFQLNRGTFVQAIDGFGTATGAEQHILMLLNGPAQTVSAYLDGVSGGDDVDASAAGVESGVPPQENPWGFGHRGTASAVIAAQFRATQLYRKIGSPGKLAATVPNLAALAVRMTASPFERLTAADLGD